MRILNPDYDTTQLFLSEKSSYQIKNFSDCSTNQSLKEASAKITKDKVTISEEGLKAQASPLWKNPPKRSIPTLPSPITHKTSNGNIYTFETVENKDYGNILFLTVTTKAGKEARFSIDRDMIISEHENGELSINNMSQQGTNNNDVVVSFSSQGTPQTNLKDGDDFILFLDDKIPEDKSKARSYDEATRTTYQNIETGNGDDEIHVISSNDSGLDELYLSTGDGNDTVNIHTPSTNKKKTSFSVITGSGDDVVQANNLSDISISTGEGDDTLKIDSISRGQIFAGNGDDEITVGNVDNSKIYSRNGDDEITVDNLHNSQVFAGKGDDKLSILTAYKSKIYSGAGDDTLLFKSISDASINTGAGKNRVIILDKLENVEFDAFGGEATFDFDIQKAKNITFLHLSDDSARSLLKILDESKLEVVTGKFEEYNLNIGLNLTSESNFENDVIRSDQAHASLQRPLKRYSSTRI